MRCPKKTPTPGCSSFSWQDDPSLEAVLGGIREPRPIRRSSRSPFTAHYFETLKAHLARVGSPAGLFEDRDDGRALAGAPAAGAGGGLPADAAPEGSRVATRRA